MLKNPDFLFCLDILRYKEKVRARKEEEKAFLKASLTADKVKRRIEILSNYPSSSSSSMEDSVSSTASSKTSEKSVLRNYKEGWWKSNQAQSIPISGTNKILYVGRSEDIFEDEVEDDDEDEEDTGKGEDKED